MGYASLAYMAPKLKKLTVVVMIQFLKYRIEFVFNIDQVNAVRAAELGAAAGNVDKQPLKISIDNDLLKVICKFKLNVSAADVTDEQLESYLNDFLKGSWTNLAWFLNKYFEEIKYDMTIVNPKSGIMDFMTQWIEISTKYSLEEILQQKQWMKAWREGLVKKLQPPPFRKDVTQTLETFETEAQAVKKNDSKF